MITPARKKRMVPLDLEILVIFFYLLCFFRLVFYLAKPLICYENVITVTEIWDRAADKYFNAQILTSFNWKQYFDVDLIHTSYITKKILHSICCVLIWNDLDPPKKKLPFSKWALPPSNVEIIIQFWMLIYWLTICPKSNFGCWSNVSQMSSSQQAAAVNKWDIKWRYSTPSFPTAQYTSPQSS